MIKKTFGSFSRVVPNRSQTYSFNLNNQPTQQWNVKQSQKGLLGNIKIQYSFARKLFNSPKPVQKTQSIPIQNFQTLKAQENIKSSTPQVYSFTDLDSDLQKYQSFLNIFNTHTKKAHQKLLTNEIKIISTIISANKNDLLQNFLAVNYRNRLANPQTTKLISQHFKSQLRQNIQKIITQPQICQQTLQRITLLTQFNQLQLFDEFLFLLAKKLNISNLQDKNLKILQSLPSKESQLLFMYDLLIKQKQLPLSIMESKYFGLNTDNLNFHKLGEIFYEFRKFMKRYFTLFSKNIQENQKQDQFKQENLKSFEKQSQKSSQASLIEDNVYCFLKTMNLQNVRKQILIDGFAVDFVVEKSDSNKNFLKKQSNLQNSQTYILEVMGSYHYTSTGKLKGRDLRKLILLGSKYRTKHYIVKILHFDDYNKSKGHRNKMELIRNLLESADKKINWQPKNQGYDSKWQLKQVYEQFK